MFLGIPDTVKRPWASQFERIMKWAKMRPPQHKMKSMTKLKSSMEALKKMKSGPILPRKALGVAVVLAGIAEGR